MLRLLTAVFVCFVLVSFLAILTAPAQGHAATVYHLEATPVNPLGGLSSFGLDWTDTTPDKLFSKAELIADSYYSHCFIDLSSGVYYRTLEVVPYYDETAQAGTPFTNGDGYEWIFSRAGHDYYYGTLSDWTYERTVVPLPPSVLLLGSGLLGLGAVGLRRRRT